MKRRGAVGSAILLVAMTAGHAQETPHGMTLVSPGKSTRVYVMAAFDSQCRSIAAPKIEIVKPPAKGSISLREGHATTVQSSLSGTCVGARVTGTGVYYTAGEGAAGEDAFTISARLSSGEVASRSFQMFISD